MSLNSPVLKLNKNFRPIEVITAEEAIVSLCNGRSEIIDIEDGIFNHHSISSWEELSHLRYEYERDEHKWIKTVDSGIKVPTVIRTLEFSKELSLDPKFSRRNVYIRDNLTCQYCGNRFKRENLNLDHVYPKSKGGRTTWNNIVCSCYSCNTRKADKTLHESGMSLIRKPVAYSAKNSYLFCKNPHKDWKYFIKFDDLVSELYWNVELQD